MSMVQKPRLVKLRLTVDCVSHYTFQHCQSCIPVRSPAFALAGLERTGAACLTVAEARISFELDHSWGPRLLLQVQHLPLHRPLCEHNVMIE